MLNTSESWPNILVLDKPPCLLNCSPVCLPGMAVPIHPGSSADGGWTGLILLISDNVVAPLLLQAQHHDLPALSLSEMTGVSGKQVASAPENLLGLVIPAKPFAPAKRLLTNNSVSTSQGLLSTNYFWIRKG